MTDYLDLTTDSGVLPTIIAAETLGALSSNMALVGLVNRDFENEVAEYGQTVTIGVRGALTANSKSEGSNVTLQAPSSTTKSVTLSNHYEVTFGQEDIARMLVRPDLIAGYAEDAAIALLEKVENTIAALYSGFSQSIDALTGLGEDDFRNAQRLLNAAKAPMSSRFAVLHEDANYEAQGIERIVNRDYAESIGNIMADRYQGRAYGFNIFMDQNIIATGGECKNIFGHRDAIALATRPMRVTDLNTVAQTVMSENGIGIRVTRWYDANGLAEQMTLDTLWGVSELRDNHGVVVRTIEI